MMRSRNLIPPSRLFQRQTRRVLRRWVLIVAIYAGALLAGYGVLQGRMNVGVHDGSGELQAASQVIAQGRKILDAQQRRLSAVLIEQAANRSVGHQPDWSILLSALAGELGDEVVFRGCRVECALPAGTGTAVNQQAAVKLDGLGKTQQSVSKFILRLEESGLFDQVKLVRTTREAMGDATAIAFQLTCSLAARGGKTR